MATGGPSSPRRPTAVGPRPSARPPLALPIRGSALLLWLALGLAVASAPPAAAQAPATVEGRVRDDEGAAVFAASVLLVRNDTLVRAAESDRLGFFRLTGVPPGDYLLRASRLGHAAAERTVSLVPGERREVEVELPRRAVELEGVRVEARQSRDRQRYEDIAGATVRDLTLDDLKRIPGVAEADPLRAVEVLPGVVSTSDFSSAFHVRGGSGDQNLILLDGAPIFSPFHLGGFFSVFNADMLDRAELRSGGFPAEHGGRVSSVLWMESDPGDGRFGVDGGVSLLATRAAVKGGAGPVADALGLRNVRWRVSARRSYFDQVLKPVFEFPYHLTDLQGVADAWTAGGDRIRLTAYSGDDVLDLTRLDAEDFPLRIAWRWGNDLVGARWTRPRRGGGSLDVSAGYTRFGTRLRFPDFADTDFRSAVDQTYARVDLSARPGGAWRLEAGASLDRLSYDNLARSGGTDFGRGLGSGWLTGAYGQAEWRAPRWIVEAGLRVDAWSPDPGEAVWEPAPRVAVKRFLGDGSTAVKAAAGRYTQYLHSLRDEELPVGLDVWILAGARAPALVSDQVQAGVERWLGDGWFASLEGYWRSFDGVVTFNPTDDPNDDLDDIAAGDGTSWGADLFLRREGEGLNGWLAVSWLRARRTFPDFLDPEEPRADVEYPPIFDRRWDVDLVLRLPLPGDWEGGLRWNVGSGLPYTRPVGSYAYYQPRVTAGGRLYWSGTDDDTDALGGYAVLLGERNAERYPPYHRLDVSVRRTFEPSWGTVTPYLDVLNVYNRKNVLFYFFEYEERPPVRSGISMFPILPTLGVEVSF